MADKEVFDPVQAAIAGQGRARSFTMANSKQPAQENVSFLLSLSKDLRDAVKLRAAFSGKTMSRVICEMLEQELSDELERVHRR